jgi:hypothetical protein
MTWSFAIVNGRLAEVFWDIKGSEGKLPQAHCYVERSEYKTKKEQQWIREDTARNRFVWRNKKYKRVTEAIS